MALQTACPGDPPTFPDPPVDAGIQCSEENACPMGQVCLSGHCFASCTAMPSSCGPLEMCAGGLCVPRPPVDAGPPDAYTPPDAPLSCAVDCETDTPFTPICRFGACVECELAVDCMGALGPVCDLGGGVCTDQVRAVCAPCDTDANCPTGATCLSRMAGDRAFERVCVMPCEAGGTCGAGFTCSAGNCVPSGTSTCTTYRAAATSPTPVSCEDASNCAPYGAAVFGLAGNARCNAGVCEIACTTPSDCPAALGLTLCTAGVCAR